MSSTATPILNEPGSTAKPLLYGTVMPQPDAELKATAPAIGQERRWFMAHSVDTEAWYRCKATTFDDAVLEAAGADMAFIAPGVRAQGQGLYRPDATSILDDVNASDEAAIRSGGIEEPLIEADRDDIAALEAMLSAAFDRWVTERPHVVNEHYSVVTDEAVPVPNRAAERDAIVAFVEGR